MTSIDLRNAIEAPDMDNFTCLLFRLIMKSDSRNRRKLGEVYPLEVAMVDIYQNRCPMMGDMVESDETRSGVAVVNERVAFEAIEELARKEIGEDE